jgi:spermidine synthase
MGAGTLAAYGRRGDYYRFYEIDPAVADLSRGAHPIFTFVQSSAAHVDVAIGDGRILMQEEVARGESQNFDILVIDAFSGDAIPVHLLTREAIEVYLRELRGPDSVIAFHLSTAALELQPLVAVLAADQNLDSVEIDTSLAEWVLISRNSGILRMPALAHPAHPIQITRVIKPWSDDYSNLYQLLRW